MASRQEVEDFLNSTFGKKEDGWIACVPVAKGRNVAVRIDFLFGDHAEETQLTMSVPLVAAEAYPINAVIASLVGIPFGLKRFGSDLALCHVVYTANVDENEILVPVRALARCAHEFSVRRSMPGRLAE